MSSLLLRCPFPHSLGPRAPMEPSMHFCPKAFCYLVGGQGSARPHLPLSAGHSLSASAQVLCLLSWLCHSLRAGREGGLSGPPASHERPLPAVSLTWSPGFVFQRPPNAPVFIIRHDSLWTPGPSTLLGAQHALSVTVRVPEPASRNPSWVLSHGIQELSRDQRRSHKRELIENTHRLP